MSLFSYQSAVCFSVILFCSLATAFILYHIFLCLSSAFFNFFRNRFFRTCILCRTAWKGFVWSLKSFRIVWIVCLIHSILLATNDILHYFSGSVNTFFYFFTLILLYCDRWGITTGIYCCLLPYCIWLRGSHCNAEIRRGKAISEFRKPEAPHPLGHGNQCYIFDV